MPRKLILVSLVLASSFAFAQTAPLKSAKEFQTDCTAALRVMQKSDGATTSLDDAKAYGECIGYIEAAVDSMRSLKQIGTDGKTYRFHLHGDGLTVKDAIVIVLDFLKKDNGSGHNEPAAAIVVEALSAKQIISTSPVTE